jgi:hypothetical protein
MTPLLMGRQRIDAILTDAAAVTSASPNDAVAQTRRHIDRYVLNDAMWNDANGPLT